MALFALISWIRHAEVTVNKLRKYKYILMPLFAVAVTV